jgi:hypothetical protein
MVRSRCQEGRSGLQEDHQEGRLDLQEDHQAARSLVEDAVLPLGGLAPALG